jgi:hypothetical protein
MGILRGVFGPSKEEIWTQISKDIGGDYIDGGFWKQKKILYKHNQWEFLLDTYSQSNGKSSTTYTRLRVPFINKDGLYFNIYQENFLSSIGKFFGSQDIQLGDRNFDDKFMIKGNNEYQIKKLLRDSKLKELFKNQPRLHIKIMDNEGWFGQSYPENVDVLYFSCVGIMKEKRALHNLFKLFTAILDRLVEIDSAYESNPNISLK